MVAWADGPRDETLAQEVVATTRQRTKDQAGIGYVTDGWAPYAEVIKTVYRDREPSAVNPRWFVLTPTPHTRLTQAVKHRKGRRLVQVEVRATIGDQADLPYAVHLERLNGSLRDRLACLTRKTHAFAKDVALWKAVVSLAIFEHNWIRWHLALRQPLPEPIDQRRYTQRSPAMVLGLSDHLWSWQEFLLFHVQQA